jgi:hypothetical protein
MRVFSTKGALSSNIWRHTSVVTSAYLYILYFSLNYLQFYLDIKLADDDVGVHGDFLSSDRLQILFCSQD